MILGYSELPWVRRIPCHFNVDLPADVHPCTQSKIHAIGAIDELLELLRRDALANFPDAEGRTLRSNRAERMVKNPLRGFERLPRPNHHREPSLFARSPTTAALCQRGTHGARGKTWMPWSGRGSDHLE